MTDTKTICRNCNTTYDSTDELIERREADPFCTGDSWYVELHYECPDCHSDDVETDVMMCDSCGEIEPCEGYDDCAVCILTDAYAHVKTYDAIDYENARKSLTDSERCAVEEQIARTIDRGRQ